MLKGTLVRLDKAPHFLAGLQALYNHLLVDQLLTLGKPCRLNVAVLKRLDRLLASASSSTAVSRNVNPTSWGLLNQRDGNLLRKFQFHLAAPAVLKQELKLPRNDPLPDLVVNRSVNILLLHDRVHQVRVLV